MLRPFFFVVVGTDGVEAGSYGRDAWPDGRAVERPPFDGGSCAHPQSFERSCEREP